MIFTLGLTNLDPMKMMESSQKSYDKRFHMSWFMSTPLNFNI